MCHTLCLKNPIHQAGVLVTLFAAMIPAAAWGFSGMEGAAFLEMATGARPAALGNAYAALATDAYAPTYNPAGLGYVQHPELAGQHVTYLDTLHYDSLSYVHPLVPGRAWGAEVRYLGTGNIAGTDRLDQSIGSYSSSYLTYAVAYGQAVLDTLSLGLAARGVRGDLSDFSASTMAGDGGIFFRPNGDLDLTATVSNAGKPLRFINQKDPLPLTYKLGAALHPTDEWLWVVEGDYEESGLASFHTGMEWTPLSLLTLRAGYRTDTIRELSVVAGVTTGIGLHVFRQEFDYAWTFEGDLGNAQYFSLVFRLGKDEPVVMKSSRRILRAEDQALLSEIGGFILHD